MKGADLLSHCENRWETDKGAWFPGKKVQYRNLDLFEAFKDKSWFFLLIFGVTGKIPSERDVKLVEGIWKISTSFPDPRLWNNRVAALAGTARSTGNLGLSAATAISEASIFGRRPDIRTIDLLISLKELEEKGLSTDDFLNSYLKKYRSIPGFGRPVVSADERILPLMKLVDELGFDDGPHLKIVKKIEFFLTSKRYRIKANIAAICAAIAADIGFSQREYYQIALLSFSAGIIPCYIDGSEHKEGTFFPLRCDVLNYVGNDKRYWL